MNYIEDVLDEDIATSIQAWEIFLEMEMISGIDR